MNNIELATAMINSIAAMLEEEIRVELDPLTKEQLQDIVDNLDNIIEMIKNIGI